MHDVIAEGDKVSVLARLTGIHRAEFMGVAASGHPIDVGVATGCVSRTAGWPSTGVSWTRVR